MILLSELSRRRIRSINKLVRVGRDECAVVVRVDQEKGYIDLSKRRLSDEEKVKCANKFEKVCTVLLAHLIEKESTVSSLFYGFIHQKSVFMCVTMGFYKLSCLKSIIFTVSNWNQAFQTT